MATGITQKYCTALFPLRSLRKNDISKMKNRYRKRKHRGKAIEESNKFRKSFTLNFINRIRAFSA